MGEIKILGTFTISQPVSNTLSSLADTTITAISDNELLQYDSGTSKWINQTLSEAGVQPLDATLTALAGLSTAADQMIYSTGSDAFSMTSLTSTARTLLDDASTSAMRTTLGLAIGTDVQAYDLNLDEIAALVPADNTFIVGNGTANWTLETAANALISLGVTATAAELNILDGVTGVTAAEISYLGDVTSLIQAQLDSKLFNTTDTFTGTLDIVGNAGIGIARTDGTLHVHTATAGVVTAHTDADDLVIENSSNGGITILTPDLNNGALYFGTASDNIGSYLIWDYTNTVATLGTSNAAGEIKFATGTNVEAMRIDSSGNVGIGTSSPDGTLHVHTASAGTVTASTSADDLVVENSTVGGISILTPDTSRAHLYFGSPTDAVGAALDWQYSTGLFRIGASKTGGAISFHTDAFTEAVRIDSSQQVGIGITSPDGPLHVHRATAGTVTADTSTDLIVESNATGGISILTPDASSSQIIFGSPNTNWGGHVRWFNGGGGSGTFDIGSNVTGAELDLKSGNGSRAIRCDANQNVVIGATTALGKLDVDQSSSTGAIPVLYLDQADVSEEFIRFDATEATGNSIEDVGAKTLTTTKFVRVNINGTDLYLQAGTIA